MRKDFDGAAWGAKHDQSFQDLIANARKNIRQKPYTVSPVAAPGSGISDTGSLDVASVTDNPGLSAVSKEGNQPPVSRPTEALDSNAISVTGKSEGGAISMPNDRRQDNTGLRDLEDGAFHTLLRSEESRSPRIMQAIRSTDDSTINADIATSRTIQS